MITKTRNGRQSQADPESILRQWREAPIPTDGPAIDWLKAAIARDFKRVGSLGVSFKTSERAALKEAVSSLRADTVFGPLIKSVWWGRGRTNHVTINFALRNEP
jgi:hypothetical protein